MKVSIIGAGNVGATLAMRIAECSLADVVMVDVLKDLAIAKSFDILDGSPLIGHERLVYGTDDYREIAASDIVVITAGLTRRPGMAREELIAKNASIVRDVSENIRKYAPGAVVLVVTNPLDAMTYIAAKATGFDRNKVFGMAGVLDGSRFAYLIAEELKVPRASVSACMMGSHGDTMVPVLSQTRVSGRPIREVASPEALERIVKRTCNRGAELVALFGSGSAYFSPSAACFTMVKAILNDTGETIVASALLDGEYGLKDIAIGVPCVIGRSGIKKIIVQHLDDDEKESFSRSANAIMDSIKAIPYKF